jgi:L-threonylcarbamoyladenylate synthase
MPIVPATHGAIRRAAAALARGEIVAFPTETVYGLGANALDARAVARVFAAKERPRFNPLIVHVPGIAEAEEYGLLNATARRLAEAFWPGPLSLVLKRRSTCGIADLVSAGLDTIALRAPAHPVAQALLAAAKLPIAAPSANRSGRVSPTTAAHVEAELGNLPAVILDGGPCRLGIESTVVSVVGDAPALLRPGALASEAIETVLGAPLAAAKADESVSSPGQLEATTRQTPSSGSTLPIVSEGEALLAFGPKAPLRRASNDQSQRERRSRKRPLPGCSAPCGPWTKKARKPSL